MNGSSATLTDERNGPGATLAELCAVKVLVCPACRAPLLHDETVLTCTDCSAIYRRHASGPLDLRLIEPKTVTVSHRVGVALPDRSGLLAVFGPLGPRAGAPDALAEVDLPVHLTRDMVSFIPVAQRDEARCLDLGCGNGEYRRPLEKLGYRWIGTDYSHPQAPFWSDAHALPLADGSFELVISLAVLEHLRYPDVALREVFRVLKPGGVFCGSVTYLVPFHDTASFYNMTHYGTYSALLDAGFLVERVASDPKYLGIRAISYSGLFLGAPRWLAYGLVSPVVLLHRLWWRSKRMRGRAGFGSERQLELSTGAFFFVARKGSEQAGSS